MPKDDPAAILAARVDGLIETIERAYHALDEINIPNLTFGLGFSAGRNDPNEILAIHRRVVRVFDQVSKAREVLAEAIPPDEEGEGEGDGNER